MENNETIGSILTRTSVRIYENGVVIAPDEVEILLRAAMAAPSAVNKQPWQFVVVDDRRLLERLGEALPYAKMAAGASLAVVVCGDQSHFLNGGDDDLWVQDLCRDRESASCRPCHRLRRGVDLCLSPRRQDGAGQGYTRSPRRDCSVQRGAHRETGTAGEAEGQVG